MLLLPVILIIEVIFYEYISREERQQLLSLAWSIFYIYKQCYCNTFVQDLKQSFRKKKGMNI